VGDGSPPRSALGLDHVGLQVTEEQLRSIQARASPLELQVKSSTDRLFTFHDRYGLFWELDTHSHADAIGLGKELEEMHRQRLQKPGG
jgi:hypothetical protein